ncbi:hypothetical protein FHG87_021564 [Trinorchestia longiramus]|nr:hypothetical protein FHG87_021564 [Trinorchestia longiramus]
MEQTLTQPGPGENFHNLKASLVKLPSSSCSMSYTASMKRAVVMVRKLTDAEVKRQCCSSNFSQQEAEVKRQCCRSNFSKQEAGVENMEYGLNNPVWEARKNSRIFKELCKEMEEKFEVLLYHTDVCWLSRGKIIHRVIELRKAIQEFLEQKGSPFATKFTEKEWLARLCYLADIFAELNSGNLQLQGRNTTVIDAHHTVAAFLGKLRLWIRRLEKGVIAQFPTLDQFIQENSHDTGSLLQTINKDMSDHLKGLETSMHHYFPESDQETASLQWIIHPFSVPDEAIHDDDFPAKEEWITMQANQALKIELQNQNADSFWISRLADSPTLSKRALKLLVSFSTTYLCKKGFSTVLGMKTKKEDSFQCCKRCQADTFKYEAKNSSTSFKYATPTISLMLLTSLDALEWLRNTCEVTEHPTKCLFRMITEKQGEKESVVAYVARSEAAFKAKYGDGAELILVDLIWLGLKSEVSRGFRGDARLRTVSEIKEMAVEMEKRKLVTVPHVEQSREGRMSRREPMVYREPVKQIYTARSPPYSRKHPSAYHWCRNEQPKQHRFESYKYQNRRVEDTRHREEGMKSAHIDILPFKIVPPPCLSCGSISYTRKDCRNIPH